MIKFKKVTLKNFLSIGDNPLTIDLNRSPTTLVSGKNGTGKTSIMTDSICFALFGKAFRNIKKQKLINTVNQRDSVVELEFTSGTNQYKIIRGQKPNRFEIYVNDVQLHEDANVSDTQQYLENIILKFDYNVFSRVVVMSSMNYTPFLHLIPNERRKFVESILNLSVFSVMEKQHKQNVALIKSELTLIDKELIHLTENLKSKKEFLEYVKNNSNNSDLKIRFKEMLAEIEVLKSDLKLIEKEVDDFPSEQLDCLKQNKTDVEIIIKNFDRDIDRTSYVISDYQSKLDYIKEHSSCDKCYQSITEDYQRKMANDYVLEIEKLDEKIQSINQEKLLQTENLAEIKQSISKLTEQFSEIEKRKSYKELELKQLMKSSKIMLEKLTAETNQEDNSKQIKEEIKQLLSTLEETQQKYENLKIKNKVASIATDLLKDEGIKSEIIKQYIPVLIKNTNYYLSKMQLPLQFKMNEFFEEQIITRFADELEYNSLSAGERARVDIALNFAWIKTAKLKGGINTNLLVLDEIADNALDQAGSLAIFDIISNELGNNDMNVFIISHKTNLEENVRSILNLEKVNGFTRIV